MHPSDYRTFRLKTRGRISINFGNEYNKMRETMYEKNTTLRLIRVSIVALEKQ